MGVKFLLKNQAISITGTKFSTATHMVTGRF